MSYTDAEYSTLQTEINTDPLGKGYSGMTDTQVRDSLNTEDRTANRSSLTGDEIFGATDNTEFVGLTDHQRVLWVSFTSKDTIDPTSSVNIAFVDYVFGTSSTTKSNLQTLRQTLISRVTELGLPTPTTADVRYARSL